MLNYDIQFFGGRGAGYENGAPSEGNGRGGKGNWGATFGNTSKPAETLKEALGDKGRRMSVDEALIGANPNRSKTFAYSEWTENCQRCVVAYELRRRGYNVTALPTSKKDDLPMQIEYGNVMYGKWNRAFKNAKMEKVGGSNYKEAQQKLEAKFKEWGSGSRAQIVIPGHVFMAEKLGNRMIYVEPQSGKRYDSKDIFRDISKRGLQEIRVVRTDNLKISDKAKQSVKQYRKSSK